jgi:hypothetical protein
MSRQIEVMEDRVPLANIHEAATELIELYGGEVRDREAESIHFILPSRRGVAAAGGVDCRMTWHPDDDGHGTVRVVADASIEPPKFQRVALLLVGVSGALLWTLWPFFPNLGPLAWIGGAVAFATYFLTARTTTSGIASDLLQRLARRQRAEAQSDRSDEGEPLTDDR